MGGAAIDGDDSSIGGATVEDEDASIGEEGVAGEGASNGKPKAAAIVAMTMSRVVRGMGRIQRVMGLGLL